MQIISHKEDKYILRFNLGEELVVELAQFCSQKNITGAWLSGLGSAQEAVVAYFDLPTKAYKDHVLSQRHEVASLIGNVAMVEGKHFVHLHGVFADSTLKTVAGHVKKLVVSATCEVRLEVILGGLKRQSDEKTGLNLLD